MGMTIEHAKKLLAVIVASISEDDDCFTIEDENVQVFKSALLVLLEAVEAIPKADYEKRLKADLKAILVELQLEIEEKYPKCDLCEYFVDYDYDENDISEYRSVGSITDITNFIQQKINSLKEA